MVSQDELAGLSGSVKADEQKEAKKEEITNTKKLVTFAEDRIEKLVISKSDSSKVFALVKVNSHYEALDLGSMRAKYWLKVAHYNETGQIFSDDSYKYALETIYAKAIFDTHTPAEFVYKRIAQTHDAIWYDLCNREGDIYKITKDGIYQAKMGLDTPIFFQTRRQAEQVVPSFNEIADPIGQLCKVLKIPYDEQTLFKIHIVSLFLEAYPMPIMAITGEQGAIKSTITQTIKRIIDPTGERFEDNINKMPDKSDDLNLAIYANYLSAFDNLSSISHEVSDDLCRAVTGQLYAKRELYTDTDEVLLAFKRKIVLNGISPNMDNGDLLERAILYQVQPIQKHERMTLEEYEQVFNTLLPFIIGQCFMILQKALALYPTIKGQLKELPRMSDFTVWGESISQGMGNRRGFFVELYLATLSDSYLDASDSHAIVSYIKYLAESNNLPVKVRQSEFYTNLKAFATEHGFDTLTQYSNFPKHSNKLRSYVKRVNPFIRNAGFELRIYRYKIRDDTKLHGTLVVEIDTTQRGLFSSEPPEPSEPTGTNPVPIPGAGSDSIGTSGSDGSDPRTMIGTTFRHDGSDGSDGSGLFQPLGMGGNRTPNLEQEKDRNHLHHAHHTHDFGEHPNSGEDTMLTSDEHGVDTLQSSTKEGKEVTIQDGERPEPTGTNPVPIPQTGGDTTGTAFHEYQCSKCPNTVYKSRESKIRELEEQHQNQHGTDHEFYQVVEDLGSTEVKN